MMPTIIQTFCTKRNLTKCEKEQEELNSGMCKRDVNNCERNKVHLATEQLQMHFRIG